MELSCSAHWVFFSYGTCMLTFNTKKKNKKKSDKGSGASANPLLPAFRSWSISFDLPVRGIGMLLCRPAPLFPSLASGISPFTRSEHRRHQNSRGGPICTKHREDQPTRKVPDPTAAWLTVRRYPYRQIGPQKIPI